MKTTTDLNEIMATEVMGLVLNAAGGYSKRVNHIVIEEVYKKGELSPTTSMDQAMKCLEATDMLWGIKWLSSNLGYNVRIITSRDFLFEVSVMTLEEIPLAICKAIAKAKGINYG